MNKYTELREAVFDMTHLIRVVLLKSQGLDPEDQDTYLDGSDTERAMCILAFLDMWYDDGGDSDSSVRALACVLRAGWDSSRPDIHRLFSGMQGYEKLSKLWWEMYNEL